MNLLLTGFEPFGGQKINSSERAAHALSGVDLPGITWHVVILPVDRERGPAALQRALDEALPDAVVCLGEAARRAAISIERVAINLLDFRIPDNSGRQCMDEPIALDGPAAYFSTLPVRAMLDAARAAGAPAELSLSAGAFLCNQIFYTLMHTLSQRGARIPAGFVHIPQLPEQVAGAEAATASMSLDTIIRGLTAALSALRAGRIQQEPDR
jgi:pyroglutamyl-peptidase